MIFKHFIITRFNLKSSSAHWKADKTKQKVLTEQWMKDRMQLFTSYCLPSVAKQDTLNFKWLIYLDTDTATAYKEQFTKLQDQYPFILPMYVNSYEQFIKAYTKDVLAAAGEECPYIITTRLDNDDVLHQEYIRKTQSHFNKQEYMAINFLKILMLHPGRYDKLHIDYRFSTHFVSLIEQVKEGTIKGCYHQGDTFWNEEGSVIQVTDKPYCIEIISSRNLANDFVGFPHFSKLSLLPFQLSGTYRNSLWDSDNLKWWKMSWRKLLIYLMRY